MKIKNILFSIAGAAALLCVTQNFSFSKQTDFSKKFATHYTNRNKQLQEQNMQLQEQRNYSHECKAKLKKLNKSFNSWYNYFRFFFNTDFKNSRYYWKLIEEIHYDIEEEQPRVIFFSTIKRPDIIHIDTGQAQKQKERIGVLLWLLDKAKKHADISGNKKLEKQVKELLRDENTFIRKRLSEITKLDENSPQIVAIEKGLKNSVNSTQFKEFWAQRNSDQTKKYSPQPIETIEIPEK